MVVVHFIENKTVVLTQIVKNIPSAHDEIKIKGRKGRVTKVEETKENVFHVYLVFEKVQKKQQLPIKDVKKKR